MYKRRQIIKEAICIRCDCARFLIGHGRGERLGCGKGERLEREPRRVGTLGDTDCTGGGQEWQYERNRSHLPLWRWAGRRKQRDKSAGSLPARLCGLFRNRQPRHGRRRSLSPCVFFHVLHVADFILTRRMQTNSSFSRPRRLTSSSPSPSSPCLSTASRAS
jgi:hypothetical protein